MRFLVVTAIGFAVWAPLLSGALAYGDDLLGFEAGESTSHFSLNPQVSGVQDSSGLLAGAFADLQVSSEGYGANYIEIELRYIKKGFSTSSSDGEGGTLSGTSSASFIELPVVIKMKIQTGTILAPYLFAGPDVALKVSESDSLSDPGLPSLTYSGVNNGIFNSVDVAFDAGAGLEVALASGLNVFGQFRYSAGLINAINYSGSRADLNGLQVSGGMSFALDQNPAPPSTTVRSATQR